MKSFYVSPPQNAFEALQAQVWSMELQLELAQTLHDQFASEHKLSMLEAIKLTPTLLDVVSICKAEGINLLEALDQLLVGNLPRHVENMLAYLPKALEVLDTLEMPEGRHPCEGGDDKVDVAPSSPIPTEIMQNGTSEAAETITEATSSRAQFISKLFCPAEDVANWANEDFRSLASTPLGLEYCECRSIREEALVALLKAKEMLETPNKSAASLRSTGSSRQAGVAIVSSDARFVQVAAALAPAVGVQLEVGHELPVVESEDFMCLRIVFRAATDNFAPVPLLALLKHRLFAWRANHGSNQLPIEAVTEPSEATTSADTQTSNQARLIHLLETKYLRGVRRYEGLVELIGLVKETELQMFLIQLRDEFAELVELVGRAEVGFQLLLAATEKLVSKLSAPRPSPVSLRSPTSPTRGEVLTQDLVSPLRTMNLRFNPVSVPTNTSPPVGEVGEHGHAEGGQSETGEGYTELSGRIEPQKTSDISNPISPSQFIPALQLLMARDVRSSMHSARSEASSGSHHSPPRQAMNSSSTASSSCPITILPPTDARLLNYDNVVITGLNEGAALDLAAQAAQSDSAQTLLNLLGLKDAAAAAGPELQRAQQLFALMHRRNSHLRDVRFAQAREAKKVLLTRSVTVNRAPQMPSRWLVRLKLLERLLGLKLSNETLRDDAAQLYVPTEPEIRKYEPPAPTPGVYWARMRAKDQAQAQGESQGIHANVEAPYPSPVSLRSPTSPTRGEVLAGASTCPTSKPIVQNAGATPEVNTSPLVGEVGERSHAEGGQSETGEGYGSTSSAFISPPSSHPPRLNRLSVTQVAQLMRNPYGIYAKLLLRLNPLDEIDKAPGQAEFGQCVHAVVQAFADQYQHPLDDASRYARDSSQPQLDDFKQRRTFDRLAKAIVERTVRNEMTRKLWLMRLDRIGDWLIKFEQRRLLASGQALQVFSEIRGKMMIQLDGCDIDSNLDDGKPEDGGDRETPSKYEFELRCIADRIEIDSARQMRIIDFKTAGIPTSANVRSFAAPQLPLEALIAMSGGFEELRGVCHPREGGPPEKNLNLDPRLRGDDNCGAHAPLTYSIHALTYIQLGSGAKFGVQTTIQADLPALISEAHRGLTALLNFYNAPTATFRCSAEVTGSTGSGVAYDDYAHLARVKELE